MFIALRVVANLFDYMVGGGGLWGGVSCNDSINCFKKLICIYEYNNN